MKYPVLLPNIFDHPFTYISDLKLNIGDYVEVPFGKNKMNGVIWDHFEKQNKKRFKIKSISRKLNINPMKKELIQFFNWFSNYNLSPLGMTLKLHFIGNEAIEKISEEKFDYYNKILKTNYYTLNEEQNNSFTKLNNPDSKFKTSVLQGTTGSGKTLVYFSLLKKKLEQQKQVLILLPEIGLTHEFERKFSDFFGFRPAIWHSSISKKNKKIIWSGISKNKIKAVIGARSSLFLPFKELGMIIVDEEHDQSYKQDEGITYNARDMAISRASFEGIPINLVSAVPSVETFNNILNGKFLLSRILNRYKNARLPDYELINLREEKKIKNNLISEKIIKKVHNHLKNKDQVLFFINRRGYSPFVICKKCLKNFICPNCSVNLVFHKKTGKILCHYCGYKTQLNNKCKIENTKCEFIYSGPGVEKIMDEVNLRFPECKSIIFSSDTMNKKNSKIEIEKIIKNETNILVGTQLISKGFHFPNLNCIVVLDIDFASRGFDLRSVEKTVQLYHQLSGRAGRTGKMSKVYFQTINKRNDIINQIINPDPFVFLKKELDIRKKNNLPPFERFVSIVISSSNASTSEKIAYNFSETLKKKVKGSIMGPINAPIYKIRGKFRNRILIRSKKNSKIQTQIKKAFSEFEFPKEIKLSVDVDPINFN